MNDLNRLLDSAWGLVSIGDNHQALAMYQEITRQLSPLHEGLPDPYMVAQLARATLGCGLASLNLQLFPQSEAALVEAIQLFREVGADQPGSSLAMEYARSFLNLGILHELLQRYDKAIDAYQQAAELYESIRVSNIGDSRSLANLAYTLGKIAGLLMQLQHFTKACAFSVRAENVYLQIGADQLDSSQIEEYVQTLMMRGALLSEMLQWEEADRYLSSAKDCYRRMGYEASHPHLMNVLKLLLLQNRGLWLLQAENFTEAREELFQALHIARSIFVERDLASSHALATVLLKYGMAEHSLKSHENALAAFVEAEQILSEVLLHDAGPLSVRFMALALRKQGEVYDDENQRSEALDRYNRAQQFYRQLGADQQDSSDLPSVNGFVELLRRHASLLAHERDQLDQAGTFYREAEQFYLSFGTDGILAASHVEKLANVLRAWGKSLASHQHWDEAIEKYRQAEDLIGTVMADQPGTSLLSVLADLLGNRGYAHNARWQWKEADQAYTDAENLYRQLSAEEPGSSEKGSLARLLKLHALLLEKTQEWDRAEAMYDEAVTLYRQLIALLPGSDYRGPYANLLSSKGDFLVGLRRWSDAQQAYNQSLEQYRQLGADSIGSSWMNEYVSVIMNAGQSWIRQGQWDQARLYYQEAENLLRLRLQADDTHFQSWGDMTWLLAEQASLNVILQKPVLALKYCEEADEIHHALRDQGQLHVLGYDGLPRMLTGMGAVRAALQQWPEALQAWRSTLDYLLQPIAHLSKPPDFLKPNLAQLHGNIGLACLNLYQFLDAEEHLTQARTLLVDMGADQRDSPWLPDLAKLMINLGLLYNRLEQWTKAKDVFEDGDFYYYCRLNADEPGSPFSQDYALLLLNQGQMLINRSKWSADPAKDHAQAQESLDKAAELYRALNNASPDRPFSLQLAMVLINLGWLHNLLEQYEISDIVIREAEQLLRELDASEVGSFSRVILAEILTLRAEQLCRQQKLPDALELLRQTNELCRQLGAHRPDSPLMKLLTRVIYFRALIHRERQEWTEMKACVDEWMQCHHQSYYFVSDLIEDLGLISHNFVFPLIKYHDSGERRHYFKSMAELIYNNQQHYLNLQADRVILKAFWSLWIEYALDRQQPFLLADILCASQARRHLSLSDLALQREKETNERVLIFMDEKHRLDQIQLKLASLSHGLRTRPDNRSIEWDIEELQEQFEATRRQLNELRKDLIEAGLYPELNSLRLDIDALKGHLLVDGQAVLLCLCLHEYPELKRQGGILLLVKKDRLMLLEAPELEQAAEAMAQVTQTLTRQGRNFNLRHTLIEPAADESRQTRLQFDGEVRTFLEDEAGHMTVLWQRLLESGELKDVKQFAIIGHGQASSLPWQGHVPVEISDLKVWQFAGLHALRNRWGLSMPMPYPTPTNPLALLACPATEEPALHLYHLEAEVRLIERIWGNERTRRITSPDDIPDACLLILLGHGDSREGRASFHMDDDRVLEPQDLLNPRYRLQALGASACLLGRSEDVDGEPMGLLSLIASRRDVQFSYGALAPVDDFLSTCLSLLFHLEWRNSEDPHKAMGLALNQLGQGNWPAEAVRLFDEVYTDYLPELFEKMQEDESYFERMERYDFPDSYKDRRRKEAILVNDRNASIRAMWCRSRSEDPVKALSVLMDNSEVHQEDKRRAARVLVNLIVKDLNQSGLSLYFKSLIHSFIPYWIWG